MSLHTFFNYSSYYKQFIGLWCILWQFLPHFFFDLSKVNTRNFQLYLTPY